MGRKYARIFVLGQYLFLEGDSFPRACFSEQIMSADKYPSIFSGQMEAIVFVTLQIFFATRAVLKIGEYVNNSLHLAQKYAKIFVLEHYLLRRANSFPRA